MRIKIVDKTVQHTLDLTPEELVNLIRYKKIDTRSVPFKIVSPVLLICDSKKFQIDIINIENVSSGGGSTYSDGGGREYYPEDDVPFESPDFQEMEEEVGSSKKKKKDPMAKMPSFTLRLEIVAQMFDALAASQEILLLLRVQNIPVYVRTNLVKVDYNMADPVKGSEKKAKPTLLVKIERVFPIVDLLKAQISESDFFDVFIAGKREEFFEKEGADLDEIVGLVGIKRKVEESDIELRMRVKDYLSIRIDQMTRIKETELQQMVKETEEKERIDKAIDDANKKNKDKK
jgi:hypothetical protein